MNLVFDPITCMFFDSEDAAMKKRIEFEKRIKSGLMEEGLMSVNDTLEVIYRDFDPKTNK